MIDDEKNELIKLKILGRKLSVRLMTVGPEKEV